MLCAGTKILAIFRTVNAIEPDLNLGIVNQNGNGISFGNADYFSGLSYSGLSDGNKNEYQRQDSGYSFRDYVFLLNFLC
jgi:hypothetical protein